MMLDEKEKTNGNGSNELDLKHSTEPHTEAKENHKDQLLLDGDSGGVSVGEGTSAEGLRIYKRRKRRKTSDSDELKIKFDDKLKAADVSSSTPDQDAKMLSFDAFTTGPGESSLRHSNNIVLRQMHTSLDGHEDGLGVCVQNTFVTRQQDGCTSVKKSLNDVERSDNQTSNSTLEPSHVSCGLLKQSEGTTELCCRALTDIVKSDKFRELFGLLLRNFGVVNIRRVLDLDSITSKMKNGAYETSPMLYLKDIQQVWSDLQHVGNEMVTLAKILSDKSKARYEQQFVRKRKAPEACCCHGCGKKAEAENCLVCDSCEDIYHLSCTELLGAQIPSRNWYCANCVSNRIGSPHDNCAVCEKLKPAIPTPLAKPVPPTDPSQDPPTRADENENPSTATCFICKSEVNLEDEYRTCAHSLCAHRYYHYNCLTSKHLGVSGPCWYCPSCLCRRCQVDKDDDQIVLCDGCDEAYHIYCTSPQLDSIPKGSWFCGKCDRELKRIKTMKMVYESLQKKVKSEDGVEEGAMKESEGLDMLVSAAKTLSHQEPFWNMRSNVL